MRVAVRGDERATRMKPAMTITTKSHAANVTPASFPMYVNATDTGIHVNKRVVPNHSRFFLTDLCASQSGIASRTLFLTIKATTKYNRGLNHKKYNQRLRHENVFFSQGSVGALLHFTQWLGRTEPRQTTKLLPLACGGATSELVNPTCGSDRNSVLFESKIAVVISISIAGA